MKPTSIEDLVIKELAKEAKAILRKKVLADIHDDKATTRERPYYRPMRSSKVLWGEYGKILQRFNITAQEMRIPFGWLLYHQIIRSKYWWLSTISTRPSQLQDKDTIRKSLMAWLIGNRIRHNEDSPDSPVTLIHWAKLEILPASESK